MNIKYLVSLLFLIQAAQVYAEEAVPLPKEAVASGSVTVERPWIKAGAEDAIMLAGFVTLKSDASERWLLQKASARYFRIVMIHRTVLQDGEPQMLLQSSLTVRAGETVSMNKQGYHLMFIGLKRKYKEGSKVKVVLQFENQAPMKINFPILKKAPK